MKYIADCITWGILSLTAATVAAEELKMTECMAKQRETSHSRCLRGK